MPFLSDTNGRPADAPFDPPTDGDVPVVPPLAPSASPSEHPDATPASPPPTVSRRSLLASVVVASVVSAGLAAGATTVLADDPAPVVADAAAGAVPRPTVDPGDGVDLDGVTDPAAVAAARIGPAVVQISTGAGVGSGVVYDPDGLVLTVAHVVGTSRTVDVRLADGTTVGGVVVGSHAETDVAVVRIDADAVQGVAELATGTRPVVGALAVAVGSPRGFDQTVTSGIVSAVDRVVNRVAMVQTDAPVNPGNSGGPLVDRHGRVLGLNDIIFSESGGSEGIGFAVAIDLAALVADQLVAGTEVQLAVLGVATTDTDDGTRGAQVVEIVPGSAADGADLAVGDVIVGLQGEPVADGGQLRARVVSLAVGTPVRLEIVRDGAAVTVTAVLGATG